MSEWCGGPARSARRPALIILTYAELEADEIDGHVPTVVHLDAKNALLSEPLVTLRS